MNANAIVKFFIYVIYFMLYIILLYIINIYYIISLYIRLLSKTFKKEDALLLLFSIRMIFVFYEQLSWKCNFYSEYWQIFVI